MEAHCRVMHNGVRETLTELRTNYWLIHGRQFVCKVIFKCLMCRRVEGRALQGFPPPALPEFHVKQSCPFQRVGVDFAGPLYVRDLDSPKVWFCLYTCCVTRAVHLEPVPNLNTAILIRCMLQTLQQLARNTKVADLSQSNNLQVRCQVLSKGCQ